jgi:hypothetical protein
VNRWRESYVCLSAHTFHLPNQYHDFEETWLRKSTKKVGFDVLSAVAVKMWDLLFCSTIKVNICFGGNYASIFRVNDKIKQEASMKRTSSSK